MCVCWWGENTGPPFSVSISSSVHGRVSGRQHKCVVRVLILAAAVVYLCVHIQCAALFVRSGGACHLPHSPQQRTQARGCSGSNSPSKHPPSHPGFPFSTRRFFPPAPSRPPFPLAHSAFPRQGPAAPSSFLLNHLLTLKSKPILVWKKKKKKTHTHTTRPGRDRVRDSRGRIEQRWGQNQRETDSVLFWSSSSWLRIKCNRIE